MSAFGSAYYPLLEVNTLSALVGNLQIFVRIRIRILLVVQSADPHVRRSACPQIRILPIATLYSYTECVLFSTARIWSD